MQAVVGQPEKPLRMARTGRLRNGAADPRAASGTAAAREKRVFPIQQDVRYQCLKGGRLAATGIGRTIDISSQEVQFTSQHPLQKGERIRLAVAWPATLEDNCLMKLEIRGPVIRCAPGTAVVRIARYEFRTRGAGLAAIDEPRFRMAASM